MRFMLLMYRDEKVWDVKPEAERLAIRQRAIDTSEALRARGIYLAGDPLLPTGTAVTVRMTGGKPTATDGPFAETKDLIAGWMIIDVDSYDRALELAGELSAAPGAGGRPIHEWLELRPIMAAPPTIED